MPYIPFFRNVWNRTYFSYLATGHTLSLTQSSTRKLGRLDVQLIIILLYNRISDIGKIRNYFNKGISKYIKFWSCRIVKISFAHHGLRFSSSQNSVPTFPTICCKSSFTRVALNGLYWMRFIYDWSLKKITVSSSSVVD